MSRLTPSPIEIAGQGIRLSSHTAGWLTRRIIVRNFGRALTSGEIALLRRYYKNRVDYSRIRVFAQALAHPSYIVTPNNEIFFPGGLYKDDYSQLPITKQADDEDKFKKELNLKWTFVHEVCHVWQFQHGYPIKQKAIEISSKGGYINSEAYKYNYFLEAKDFNEYNMEQQASIIEDYAKITNNLIFRNFHEIRARYITAVVSKFLDENITDEALLPITTDFPDMEAYYKMIEQEIQDQLPIFEVDFRNIKY